ncbi:hypothetical protein GALL_329810 [mine drainage metagenome]|jgi:hypothetical protein|uniref:Uncharacterized protein n=1 Tax=mine drainage metagenome TaxID=410659 RepID=A0A1J5RAL4_9ZZZZ
MTRTAIAALCVLTMIAVIVGVDVLFLRHRFWVRLWVNIGVVAVFAVAYMRFAKKH